MNVQLRLTCLLLLLLAAACGPEQDIARGSGPVLLRDVTLVPTTPAPTRVLSPTPSPVSIPVSTSEVKSVLEVVTLESDFVLITPTLPPSKTPTATPTITSTPTRTPPARLTLPPLPTLFVQPTAYIPPPIGNNVPQPVIGGAPQACSTAWFFARPVIQGCPMNPPLVSAGSFQQFQKGFMLWVPKHGAIYVLYDSADPPRQPRRGFGLLWRSLADVRQRLGWAVIEWETNFTVQMQTGPDGWIYVSEPRGGVFALAADGSEWKRYE
ncbi:MAG: hypothetical protein HZC41_14400 [Chloroflexi bacterium]|nr:hypothetical protein [Chloroflexota bacterium]